MRDHLYGIHAWLLLFAVAFSGCTTIHLADVDRRSVGAVSVRPEVEQPATLEYFGPAIEGYEPFPPGYYHVPIIRELTIVYAATPPGWWQISRAYARMERAITARMDAAGVDVGEIVRSRFIDALEDSELFSDVVESGGDARFRLAVECGLSTAGGGFQPGVRPWLEVTGALVHRDGRVLWRRAVSVSTFQENVPAHEIDRIFLQPKLFRQAVSRAARIAVGELVQHMGENRRRRVTSRSTRRGKALADTGADD